MSSPTSPGLRSWALAAAAAVLSFLIARALLPDHQRAADSVRREVAASGPSIEPGRAALSDVDERTAEAAAPAELTAAPAVERASDDLAAAAPAVAAPAVVETAATAPGSALLYGVVTDGEGQAIDDVSLYTRTPGGKVVGTSTDASGRYALGPLPPGLWSITTYAEGRQCPEMNVQIEANSAMVRRDLLLPMLQIVRVDVVNGAGEPAIPGLRESGLLRGRAGAGLVPIATRERPGETFEVDFGDLWQWSGVGTPLFRLPQGEERREAELARMSIQEPGPCWISLVSHHCVLASFPVSPGDTELRFTVEPEDLQALRATVRASLVDGETGAPVAAAAAIESNPFPSNSGLTPNDPRTGASELANVNPGQGFWLVSAEGYADVVRKVSVPRGGTLDLGTVRLQRPVVISGTVKNAEGRPIEAVLRLSQLDPSTGSYVSNSQLRRQSRSDGSFRLEGLQPARYTLQVSGTPARSPRPFDPALRSMPVALDVRNGSIDSVGLTVAATTHVTFNTGKLADPWPYLRAVDSAGLTADGTWLGRWFAEAWIDVLPGDYTLRVQKGDGSVFEQELTVGSEPLLVELDETL